MTTAKARKVQIGSVSTGTLRTEDLLEAFSWELDYLTHGKPGVETYQTLKDAETVDADSEEAAYILESLQDALSSHAPPLTYFGTLEGDGANFGFWPDWDAIQEARDLASDYGDGYHLEDDGVFMFADECNVTVYADDNGKPGAELWSVV